MTKSLHTGIFANGSQVSTVAGLWSSTMFSRHCLQASSLQWHHGPVCMSTQAGTVGLRTMHWQQLLLFCRLAPTERPAQSVNQLQATYLIIASRIMLRCQSDKASSSLISLTALRQDCSVDLMTHSESFNIILWQGTVSIFPVCMTHTLCALAAAASRLTSIPSGPLGRLQQHSLVDWCTCKTVCKPTQRPCLAALAAQSHSTRLLPARSQWHSIDYWVLVKGVPKRTHSNLPTTHTHTRTMHGMPISPPCGEWHEQLAFHFVHVPNSFQLTKQMAGCLACALQMLYTYTCTCHSVLSGP